MNILVCISNVPDTTTKIRFTDNNTAFDTTGVQWIINPWDEYAIEAALERLAEKRKIVIDDGLPDGSMVYSAAYHTCEAGIADRLLRVDVKGHEGHISD